MSSLPSRFIVSCKEGFKWIGFFFFFLLLPVYLNYSRQPLSTDNTPVSSHHAHGTDDLMTNHNDVECKCCSVPLSKYKQQIPMIQEMCKYLFLNKL